MIQNERQYEVTKQKLSESQAALRESEAKARPGLARPPEWHPLLGDLQPELDEYEPLRRGSV